VKFECAKCEHSEDDREGLPIDKYIREIDDHFRNFARRWFIFCNELFGVILTVDSEGQFRVKGLVATPGNL